MATTRKTAARKGGVKKPAGNTTKAKAKRVADNATAAVKVAAQDAGLALRRTAQKLETKLEEAKEPAKQTARRVERKVTSVLASAGESITNMGQRAKRSFDAARKAFAETPAVKKRAAKKSAAKKPAVAKRAAAKPRTQRKTAA
jgi:hypothetical protein